jgi:hypothetical protein
MPSIALHNLTLTGHGTLEATIVSDNQPLTVTVSYLSDAITDLAHAALALIRSPVLDSVHFSWQDEPGEYRWIVHREGAEVRIAILRFDDCFSRLPDERGRCVFKAHCTPMRFAKQVKGQLQQLLNALGEESYQARWGHPFPMVTFQELAAQIQDHTQPLEPL